MVERVLATSHFVAAHAGLGILVYAPAIPTPTPTRDTFWFARMWLLGVGGGSVDKKERRCVLNAGTGSHRCPGGRGREGRGEALQGVGTAGLSRADPGAAWGVEKPCTSGRRDRAQGERQPHSVPSSGRSHGGELGQSAHRPGRA